MPLTKFVSKWKEFVARNYPENDWKVVRIPRMNEQRIFDDIFACYPKCFDIFCRKLCPRRDTMQATDEFMDANSLYLEKCETQTHHSNRQVSACRLTGEAVSTAEKLEAEAAEKPPGGCFQGCAVGMWIVELLVIVGIGIICFLLAVYFVFSGIFS